MGWSDRVRKYKFHYILMLPALILIVAFKGLPVLGGIYHAFVDDDLISDRSWVGWSHFTDLFSRSEWWRIVFNTLSIKIGYMIIGGLLALVLALALSLIRSARWRSFFSTLLLVPYFLPAVVVGYVAIIVLSPENSPFFQLDQLVIGHQSLFQPLFIVLQVLKTCGIPVMIALAAIWSRQEQAELEGREAGGFMAMNVLPAAKACAAFMLLQLSTIMSVDRELLLTLINPLVYATGETVDSYMFRIGFMQMQIGTASALWLVQAAVQFVFTLLAYAVVRAWLWRDLFRLKAERISRIQTKHSTVSGIIMMSVFSLLIVIPLYVLFVYPFLTETSWSAAGLLPVSSYVGYMLLYIAVVVLHMLLVLVLAYPLTVRKLPGRGVYKLILLAAIAAGTGTVHEFLYYKNIGVFPSVWPLVMNGWLSFVAVFVLKSWFNRKYGDLKQQAEMEGRGEAHTFVHLFVPKVWKPLLALGALQFASLWNSYYESLIYLPASSQFPPVLLFRQMVIGQAAIEYSPPELLLMGAVVSLPPLVLLVLFRKWIGSELLWSQIRKL